MKITYEITTDETLGTERWVGAYLGHIVVLEKVQKNPELWHCQVSKTTVGYEHTARDASFAAGNYVKNLVR